MSKKGGLFNGLRGLFERELSKDSALQPHWDKDDILSRKTARPVGM